MLRLTVETEPFQAICTEAKKEEYRIDCNWIRSRLLDKNKNIRSYKTVKFYLGGVFDDSLDCTVECQGITKSTEIKFWGQMSFPIGSYVTTLGEVLEITETTYSSLLKYYGGCPY